MSSLSQFSSKSEFNSSSLISRASSKNWLVLALFASHSLGSYFEKLLFFDKDKKKQKMIKQL